MRRGIMRALVWAKWSVDQSPVLALGCFLLASMVEKVRHGDVHNFGTLMFFFAVLPFCIINVVYPALRLLAGMGIDRQRITWLWMSLIPFPGMLVASLRSQTFNDIAYWGIAIPYILTGMVYGLMAVWAFLRLVWDWLKTPR